MPQPGRRRRRRFSSSPQRPEFWWRITRTQQTHPIDPSHVF
ncbi:MAG: hypothetical protein ACYS47_13810 [Planctomycetota bacterium]